MRKVLFYHYICNVCTLNIFNLYQEQFVDKITRERFTICASKINEEINVVRKMNHMFGIRLT